MSKFGQTLFAGRGFVRWALSPFVLLFAVFMPLLIDEWTVCRVILMAGIELMCLCLLAGFWLPPRSGYWAFRVLAGIVAVGYVAYFVDEYFINDKAITFTGRRSDASPFNALLGFLFFGLPCLSYAIMGNFLSKPPSDPGSGEYAIGPDEDDT